MTVGEFRTWTEYWGELATVVDELLDGSVRHTTLHAFENVSEANRLRSSVTITEERGSAVFGYVTEGSVRIADSQTHERTIVLNAGEYFALSTPVRFDLFPDRESRLVVVQCDRFVPFRTFGGPVEPKGRLRYIDRCSDSLLIAPPRLGDPCLNLLHFPPGIHQTMHTHPSIRCGAIASGAGYCIDGDNVKLDLLPGMVWVIPVDTVHSFHTADSGDNLNVIAYHPDTDWGPEDETHPMLNRTWVDGTKIDNTTEQHADPDVMVFD